jgi:hypothetical protein
VDNGNGTYTDNDGNLVVIGEDGTKEVYTPVKSDISGVYLDENKKIVYTGADGIPNTPDDDEFVVIDYPLPIQETLFSIKYPLMAHQEEEYQIELDFADGRAYSLDTIRFISSDLNVLTVDATGKIKMISVVSSTATIACILTDGSTITKKYTTISKDLPEGYNVASLNSPGQEDIVENSTRPLTALRVVPKEGSNANNLNTRTFSILSDGDPDNTGSSVTPGGWFHAGTPGSVTVTNTVTNIDGSSATGVIIVKIISANPTPEIPPYVTESTNWYTLEPAPAYAGGDGTKTNPYQISSVRQFKKLSLDVELLGATDATYQKYFELTADLDFLGDNTVKQSLIGEFQGNFDGKGHLIKDLIQVSVANSSVFGSLSYGEIKNLGREGGRTESDAGASGLVYAISMRGKISNCYNSAPISGKVNAIGLVCSFVSGAIMENCYNTGDVTSTDPVSRAGGLAGSVLYQGGTVTIINSYNTGNVNTQRNAGGLFYMINTSAGNKQILNLTNCFNFGNVTITGTGNEVGSLIGRINEPSSDLVEVIANNVYSRPDVAANQGTTPKPNRPIGWMTSTEAIKDYVINTNPTLKEDAKYTLDYSQTAAFVTELGSAFKYAEGRPPKLAWEQ